jgi:catechol 2,3-dioxygenase-like lactoylglutathione lyase family enzyme
MFDHIQIKVKDLQSSKRFYTAALAPLGFTKEYDGDGVIGFGPKGAPALWLAEGESRGPVHIAFTAKDRAAVRAFYAAALPAGGQDNGEPGLRPKYHANYYGGFVKDPDGNNIEAVCHQEE